MQECSYMKAAKKIDEGFVSVIRGNNIRQLDDTIKVYTAKKIAPFCEPIGGLFEGACLMPGAIFPDSMPLSIDCPWNAVTRW